MKHAASSLFYGIPNPASAYNTRLILTINLLLLDTAHQATLKK